MTPRALALAFSLAACGISNPPKQLDAGFDAHVEPIDAATGGPFALASNMLSEGGMFAPINTCDGMNISPELAWVNPPPGTMSFAVVLTDKTKSLVHWVIYDIPANLSGLPEGVQKAYAPANVAGAHQTTAYNTNTTGYLGPCPPQGQGPHTYELAVYALDVPILPGTSQLTTRQQAVPLIEMHMIAKATLTGTFAH